MADCAAAPAGCRAAMRRIETSSRRASSPISLLLDIDGTLVRTDPVYFAVFRELLAPHGYDVTREWYEENVHGRVDADVFRALMPSSYGEDELREASRRKDALFCEKASALWVDSESTPTVAGLAGALAMARDRGMRCVAVTNAPRPAAELVLACLRRSLDAGDVIEDLVVGSECASAKPAPDPYLVAMRRIGADPLDCVVFEDSRSGVRSGVSAGVGAVVGVRSELSDDELRAAGATRTVADWREVTAEMVEALVSDARQARGPPPPRPEAAAPA